MEKKNKIILMIIGVAVMLVGLVGATFAYYSATVKIENEENKTTSLSTETLVKATMDLGDLVEGSNILPGHKIIKTITVTGEGAPNARPIQANITLTPEVSDFKNHVKYSLYEVESAEAKDPSTICTASKPTITSNQYYDAMECNVSDLGTPVLSGTFSGTTPVEKEITVKSNTKKTYYLLIEYVNTIEEDQNDEQGKTFTVSIGFGVPYKEGILNGADPILANDLIPVMIDNTGKVKKADTTGEWYNYENKVWANAVILNDKKISYASNEEIPESNIESYFVWVPKYSYQLWDLGNYDGVTNIDESKVHEIPIRFGTTNTSDTIEGECTTPMNEEKTQGLSGENGNCVIGDYMTHPAFISMNTTGLWVGKFETGYKGAISTASAEVNNSDASKVTIKPNTYSWRNINVSNAFETSYNYQRNLDSHLMKNTEWGSVAYLQHSKYGSATSVRTNNNSAYITGYAAKNEPTVIGRTNNTDYESTSLGVDGTKTYNYNNPQSQVASTTGNYSGVYDMSGGAWEYVMGVMLNQTNTAPLNGNSEFTSFPDARYYDIYLYDTSNTTYNRGILGDATKEMGPFALKDSEQISSWYTDGAYFAAPVSTWILRGLNWSWGMEAGIFAFGRNTGAPNSLFGFRIILAI